MVDPSEQPSARSISSEAVRVEQSLALAVQDATDFLRATMTLAIGAFGAGTAQFLATGDSRFLAVVDTSQRSIAIATETLAETLTLVGVATREIDTKA